MSQASNTESAIRTALHNMEADVNFLDSKFDSGIVGLVEGGFGAWGVVCYDRDTALALMTSAGISADEAEGFFYNVLTCPMDSDKPRLLHKSADMLSSAPEQTMRQYINQLDGKFMLMEPETMDAAIMGLLQVGGEVGSVVCYDRDKVIEILMADGMDRDDAEEFYSFNIEGAYVGPETPIFLTTAQSIIDNYGDEA